MADEMPTANYTVRSLSTCGFYVPSPKDDYLDRQAGQTQLSTIQIISFQFDLDSILPTPVSVVHVRPANVEACMCLGVWWRPWNGAGE